MRSLASVGKHPLHPVLVTLPLGAFGVALFADMFRVMGLSPMWATTAKHALLIGIVSAVLAAALGVIDYVFVKMSPRAHQIATYHMVVNLSAVVLMVVSFGLRVADPSGWTASAAAVSSFAFVGLMVGGWLGGELVFRHKVAVIESADPQATVIGKQEDSDLQRRDARAGIDLVADSHRH